MLTTGPANLIRQEVQTQTVLEPKVKLLAEFNNNRFANPKLVLNGTIFDESMDPNSVIEINRPRTEIRYGIAGYAKCTSKESSTARYRAAGSDSEYKYLRSNVLGSANNNAFDVHVTYQGARSNVLYAKFNTHGGIVRPSSVRLQYRTSSGGAWQTAGTFTPNTAGEVIAYRQADGTWGTTKTYQAQETLWGLRLIVITASTTGRTELVELAAKFIVDLSEDVITFSVNYSKEEPSLTQPLGVGQAGSLSLTLDDKSNKFSQGVVGTYNKFAERDAKFIISLGYVVDSETWYIDQPEYWSDSWNFNSADGSVSIECTDRSRWIQKATVSDVIFEDSPVPFVVQEIMEIAGISGFNWRRSNLDGKERLPWVWYEDGESLWSAIGTIARAVNASFYYNSAGDLTWVSKNKDYETAEPQYKFSSEQEGSVLPNLFGYQQQFEEVFNSVKVSYELLDPNVNALGDPTRQSLWEAQAPLSIRSSDLVLPITSLSADPVPQVVIPADDIEIWPFEGKFQIEGEVFSYEGKYHTNGNISLNAEEAKTNGAYSGRFANVVRAIDGSTPDVHLFGTTGGLTQYTMSGPVTDKPPARFRIEDGQLNLKTQAVRATYAGQDPGYHYTAMTRGVDIDSYSVYGTEVTFPISAKGRKQNIAGLVLHRQTGNGSEAYYFELLTTDYVVNGRNSAVGNLRCYRNNGEVNIYKPAPSVDPQARIGYFTNIEYDKPYRLEVHVGTDVNGDQTFSVYLNGNHMTGFTDSIFTSGLWGVYTRGDTEANFEFFYAYENDADHRFNTNEKNITSWVAQQKLYNRISGDYTYMGPEIAQSGRAGKYRWFFEEFQPVVHERRDFDIEHSVSPAFNFFMLNSNPTGIVIRDLHHTPFNTRFVMDNASRKNEFIAGEDPQGGQYIMQLFGQPMARLDAQHITVQDARSIREHGLNELEYSNPWIQTEDQAKEQGSFIRNRWATPVDVASAEVIYDPTIELGDLIEIEHYERKIYSRYYFVTGISVGWDNGYTCSLTLRRNPL